MPRRAACGARTARPGLCVRVFALAAAVLAAACLCGCSGGGSAGAQNAGADQAVAVGEGNGADESANAGVAAGGADESAGAGPTGGAAFAPQFRDVEFDAAALNGSRKAGIDVSHAAQGYVVAVGESDQPLKFTVTHGQDVAAYDLPGNGQPTVFPLTAGSGRYRLAVLRSTGGSRFAEVYAGTVDVELEDSFAPFLRPSAWCSYTSQSACVAKARQLTQGCATQAQALAAVFDYVVDNVEYDVDKAEALAQESGYVPNPDATLEQGRGICSDYACLVAAMLRSIGIPTQIAVGRVLPDDFTHAWNLVYVDGSWHTAQVDVQAGRWSLVDATLAAGGGTEDPPQYYQQRVY